MSGSAHSPPGGPLSGRTLRGRYRLGALLAESMSCVYEAQDLSRDARVVVKVASSNHAGAMARLVAERETLVRLSHPGIVRCLDFWADETHVYLVLEWIPGRSLLDLSREEAPFPQARLLDWGLQLAGILRYLHDQRPPVIHRDVKPQHALLDRRGRIRLIDFGIARVRRGELRDTECLGTPGYAAPEQYGSLPMESDERTDVFGLGATLFHLATGRLLSEAVTPDPREYNPTLSEGFARVVQRAVAGDPEERYPTMAALQEALQACRRDRQRRTLVPALTGVACAAGAGAAGYQGALWVKEGGSPLPLLLGCLAVGLLGLAFPLFRTWRTGFAALLFLAPVLNLRAAADLEAHLRRLGLNAAPLLVELPWLGWGLAGAGLGLLVWSAGRGKARIRLLRTTSLLALLAVPLIWSASLNRAQDTWMHPDANFPGPVVWEREMPGLEEFRALGRGEDQQALLLALTATRLRVLDPATGRDLWGRSRPSPTAVTEHEGLLMVPRGTRLDALRASDGSTAWSLDLGRAWKYCWWEEPLLVVAYGDGSLVAVDSRTGKRLWTRPSAGGVIRGTWGKRLILVQDPPGRLTLVRLEDGREEWSRETGLRYGTHWNWSDGKRELLLWLAQRGVVAYNASGREEYRLVGPAPRDYRVAEAPAFFGADPVVVAAGNQVLAFDPANGRALWSRRLGLEEVTGLENGQGVACVATLSGRLLGLSLPDGRLRWEHWPRRRDGRPIREESRRLRPLGILAYGDHLLVPLPGQSEALVLGSRDAALERRMAFGEYRLEGLESMEGRLILGLRGRGGEAKLVCREAGGAIRGGHVNW